MSLNRRHLLVLAAGSALSSRAGAAAVPPELVGAWPQTRLVGSGEMRYFGLHIYDARLWAPTPLSAEGWTSQPFALELQYARAFDAAAIARRSLDEMRRQGPIAPARLERWRATMQATFPGVRDGDRLTGIHLPESAARFHFNGRFVGEWTDAELARQFFGIWLAPQTSEPALREALLGGRV
jgi:hypothetical protein